MSELLVKSHVVPPSHILNDGRFVHLPPPSTAERAALFERLIAHHGLIHATGSRKAPQEEEEEEDPTTATTTAAEASSVQKVHPLALASAKLNALGVSELSKAINLGGLVGSGEYFGWSNVVVGNSSSKKEGGNKDSETAATPGEEDVDEEEDRWRALHVLRTKQQQRVGTAITAGTAQQGSLLFLEQHARKLWVGTTAQRTLDERLVQLRAQWRLVAPEHGTRTVTPVRPSETIAVDVQIYPRDEAGPTTIARRVPRYATLSLDLDTYSIRREVSTRKRKRQTIQTDETTTTSDMDIDTEKTPMKIEESLGATTDDNDKTGAFVCNTMAEPFAIADPTLGKIDADFDPDAVPLLSLLFRIEKSSTGFSQSVTLTSSTTPSNDTKKCNDTAKDEGKIMALQHSLFCASLFDEIRREIGSSQKGSNTVWLSSEMEETFLPPPSLLAASDHENGLCVVHCHEGEVKVQLDSEYALTVQLVEASRIPTEEQANSIDLKDVTPEVTVSGSQSPAQLKALCRALLLQAQFVFHDSCTKQSIPTSPTKPLSSVHKEKMTQPPSPRILHSCVRLGAKMLLERKIRFTVNRLAHWLKSQKGQVVQLKTEWLPLSLFDFHSQFVLFVESEEDGSSGSSLLMDISIEGGSHICVTTYPDDNASGTTITATVADSTHQTVTFGSAQELELFLKLQISNRFQNN